MKNLHILTTSLAAIAASTQSISAETLLVPEQYPDIQSAINAASNGDTVDVGPGTYEGFFLSNQNQAPIVLSVISRSGSESTFLSSPPPNSTRMISIDSYLGGTEILVSGFTIKDYIHENSSDLIIALQYDETSVKLNDFKMINCTKTQSEAAMIYGGNWENVEFIGCSGRIYQSAQDIKNAIFHSCSSNNDLVRDSTISECTFTNCGGTDLVTQSYVQNGYFQGNVVRSCLRLPTSFTVEGCRFESNEGMQIYVDGSNTSYQGQVINCQFENNSSANFGTGIFSRWGGQIYISGCEFFGNTANIASGAIHQESGEVILFGTDVCGNLPNNIGGSVEFDDPSNNISVNCEEEVSCCLPGSCLVLPASTCADAGGISLTGECNQEDCPNEGACCIDGDCVFTTLETCFDLGGNYAGFGTDCASTICESTCEGDISGNGDVGLTDLIAVLSNWGPCPG